MGQGIAVALAATGATVTVTGRTPAKVVDLAARIGGRAAALDSLAALIAGADVLLTSTGASEAIVTPEHVADRVGEPLAVDGPELAPHRVRDAFAPFSQTATARHGQAFQTITDIVMARINELLDPEYQADPSGESDGVHGVERFAIGTHRS